MLRGERKAESARLKQRLSREVGAQIGQAAPGAAIFKHGHQQRLQIARGQRTQAGEQRVAGGTKGAQDPRQDRTLRKHGVEPIGSTTPDQLASAGCAFQVSGLAAARVLGAAGAW